MNKIVIFLDKDCGPSQQMLKLLPDIKKKHEVEVVRIQGDPARVKANGVLAVPTIQIFNKNGQILKTLVGYNVNILNKIEEVVHDSNSQ